MCWRRLCFRTCSNWFSVDGFFVEFPTSDIPLSFLAWRVGRIPYGFRRTKPIPTSPKSIIHYPDFSWILWHSHFDISSTTITSCTGRGAPSRVSPYAEFMTCQHEFMGGFAVTFFARQATGKIRSPSVMATSVSVQTLQGKLSERWRSMATRSLACTCQCM